MHGVGQLLGAELVVRALGETFQYLKVAHAQAVPLAELTLQRGADGRVPGGDLPPDADHLVR